MVMRANKNMSASSLQGELLKTIRSEFEHNLSQQIYMSTKSWDAAVKAKEETIKIINVAGTQLNPEASGMEFAQAVINISSQLTHLPTKDAVDIIKKEIAREF
jgi:NifB/MoaA-like Fe-S oxidoreductase